MTQGSKLLIATERNTFPGAIFSLVRVSLNVLPDGMQIIPEHTLKTKLISTSKTEQLSPWNRGVKHKAWGQNEPSKDNNLTHWKAIDNVKEGINSGLLAVHINYGTL